MPKELKPLPDSMQIAQRNISRHFEYFTTLLWNIRFVEKPGMMQEAGSPIGIDEHWRCYYDPEIDTLVKPEEMQGVILHELNHPLRYYHVRARKLVGLPESLSEAMQKIQRMTPTEQAEVAEQLRHANLCHDMEFNPSIKAVLPLPQWTAGLPSKFGLPENLLMEEYFHQEGKHKQKQPGGCGCSAIAEPWHDGEPEPDDRLSEAEKEIIRRQVAKDVLQRAKEAGNVPSDLVRWAQDLIEPRIPWTQELAANLRHAITATSGRTHRSWHLPNRATSVLASKVIYPSWQARVPNLGLIFDTSGSMSGDHDLAIAFAETQSLLRQFAGRANVISLSVDCAVHNKQRVSNARQIQLQGGGGTDMCVGLAALAEHKPPVDIGVCFTDGYTPWPSEETPYRLIVVLTNESQQAEVPPWARTIVVN